MNRAVFFDHVRAHLYGGRIRQQSVIDGLNKILSRAEELRWPLAWTAYLIATVYHETAHTFAAIREFGRGKGRRYGVKVGPFLLVYYGRGWPQLTWYENYLKQENKLGIPLARDPDLMLDIDVSAKVTFGGMADGDFTGKKLADYITGETIDFPGARRIINGRDRAHRIAGYADIVLDALELAEGVPEPLPRPDRTPAANPDSRRDAAGQTGAAGGGATAAGGGTAPLDPTLADWLLWGGLAVAGVSILYLAWRYREHIFVRLALLTQKGT